MRASRIVFAALLLLAACQEKKQNPTPVAPRYSHGAYILCEGNYGWGEGSVYYLDTSWKSTEAVDAYKIANGFRAGNVVQSMTVSGDTAYLVVNNSNKVEMLETHTLKRLKANTSLTSPRYTLPLGGTLLVTDLYANRISLLDRLTLTTQGTLPASGWTEACIRQGNAVYVANRRTSATAAGAVNEQLLVVQLPDIAVTDSIKLGGQGAQELVPLTDGTLITGLENVFSLNNAPGLALVTPATGMIRHSPGLPGRTQQPIRIQAVGGLLFWLQGDALCWMPEAGGTVRSIQTFGAGANLTSLQVRVLAEGKARVWVADAHDYTSAGILRELDLDTETGIFTVQHETRLGIIPGQIVLF